MNNDRNKIPVDESKIKPDLEKITGWYNNIEASFPVKMLDVSLGSRLLNGKLNLEEPLHSWFVLKEAFSFEFPLWVVDKITNEYRVNIFNALDPFIGCGTTGVALSTRGINVDGVEYNPFIRFVASVKARVKHFDSESLSGFINKLGKQIALDVDVEDYPALTTFHNTDYFRRSDVEYLRAILAEINSDVESRDTKDFLKLGLAKSLESISNLRKDGRALRYTLKEKRPVASELLPCLWKRMIESLSNPIYSNVSFSIYEGNSTNLKQVRDVLTNSNKSVDLPSGYYDLVLYSPPYLNNFDYTEIYKLELWMLNFITSYQEWGQIRKKTIRSHPSIKFEQSEHLLSNESTQEVHDWLKFLASSNCLWGRARQDMPHVILGYFEDMYACLLEQFRVLKSGGILVYVVANSRHCSLPIATDVILGTLAQSIGFDPLELVVLKKRNGRTRQKEYLRESAVFLRKP